MSYRFEAGEPVARAVKRVAREQIDRAVTEIDTRNLGYAARVHQVRKRCKKLRALARLARPALGDQHGAIDAHWRDTARALSGVRDAQALVQAHDTVLAAHADEIPPETFAEVRDGLVARRERIEAETDLGALLDRTRQAMRTGRAAIDTWQLRREGFDAVAGGLRRTAKRHRKAHRRAAGSPDAGRQHAWRKRAKDLRHQLRLLEPVWPRVMPAVSAEADRLSELLGQEHDLHVLRGVILAEPPLRAVESTPAYLDLLTRQQDTLRAEAEVIGRRLAAEKPKRLVRRLAAYDAAADGLR
jgi:CHAD domain-containing protein